MTEQITITAEKLGSYVVTLPISAITVSSRFRQDMGDIAALAASIKELGLLQPIGIDRDHNLIFGERRLRAHQHLGLDNIQARIIEVPSLLQAEHDENELRKSFTPSERVAIARAIEDELKAMERRGRPKAETGQGELIESEIPAYLPELRGRETRDIAAERAWFESTTTYRQAKTVVKEAVPELVAAMDRGEIAISTAAKLAKAEPEVQMEAVANPKAAPKVASFVGQFPEKVPGRRVDVMANAITLEAWRGFDDESRQAILAKPTTKKMNIQENESIGWAAYSWNPITGCEHDCSYCYARDIANRFYGEIGFKPALHPDRLQAPRNTKPQKDNARVFVCSMADLFGKWVPKEWIDSVLMEIERNKEFDFLLLTKNPARLLEFDFPGNAWVGTTCDTQRRMDVAQRLFPKIKAGIKWVSVEPMLEPIRIKGASKVFDWIVIGGASATSGQKGFVPPFEWTANLASDCYRQGSRIYVKANIRESWPMEFPVKDAKEVWAND